MPGLSVSDRKRQSGTLLAPPSLPIRGAHQTDASITQPTWADSRDLLTGRSTRLGFGGDSTGLRPPVAASQSAMYPTWSSTERSVTSITSFGITELSISFSMVCWSLMKIVRSSYCDGLLEILRRCLRASAKESGWRQQNINRNPRAAKRDSNHPNLYRTPR